MDLIATPGSPLANSYVTVATANTFLEGRLYTEPWFGIHALDETELVSVATRETALLWATSLLDTQVRWYGTPTTMTQALAWPMQGQVDHLGRPIPLDIVPSVIQQATAFYALALLRDDREAPDSSPDAKVKRKKIGDTDIEFRDQAVSAPAAQGIPSEVRALLRPYGFMVGSMMVPVFRT